jgi:hypothetical protein
MPTRGGAVWAHHYVIRAQPPGTDPDGSGYLSWGQEIEGTPFERVLSEAVTEIAFQAEKGGTQVTITQTQKLRGYSRTGGFLLRRATRRKLDEALDGLAEVV